jgi:hypothetical protein
MGKLLIGSLTRAYTAAEYATKGEDCPAVGYVFEDEQNGKRYIFAENQGAASIPENHCATLYTGQEANYKVQLSTGLNGLFAGVRPDGADALTQDTFGYLQIAGPAIGIHGDSAAAITAELQVVLDDDTDGGTIGGYASGITPFAVAHEASSTTDAEVDMTIYWNVWGK